MNTKLKACIFLLTSLFLAACSASVTKKAYVESEKDSTNEKELTQFVEDDKVLQIEEAMTKTGSFSQIPAKQVPQSATEEEMSLQMTKEEEILQTMTIEEKIGQLFVYAFRGKDALMFNKGMQFILEEYQPGGVVLFPENIKSQEQVKLMIGKLQSYSKYPLFISVDEEGGRVTRVGRVMNDEAPSASVIGASASVELAFENGANIGKNLSALGFNMNFAPVADINTNSENTVIGDRAFGNDPTQVSLMVEATVKGLKSENILTVLKHFPGHGDTIEDSHDGIAILNQSLERLREREFVPFAKGIEAGADFIMVGHVSVPSLTGNNEPAIFSKRIVNDILREELQFDGTIITDAMDMGAITNYYTAGEAALKAFQAGNDIILMPENVEDAYNSMLEAYDNNIITDEQIDQAVLRILRAKSKFWN